jgi:hypothetical protein
MENKIDQFFKGKLDGHMLPPSEEAWAKVEAGLSKKNNVAVWRIAAAVLITGALVSVIIWPQPKTENSQPVVAETQSPTARPSKEKPLVSKSQRNAIAASPKKAVTMPIQPTVVVKEQHMDEIKAGESLPIENKLSSAAESVAVMEKNNIEENKKLEATRPVVIASTKQKPIKLEFTLEDFSSEPVATVSEQKSSGLKKVWELAREVKNGDGPVREIKNELFAFNFRKNKTQ